MLKKDIDFIYKLYVDAVVKLASIKPIIEVGIFDKSPMNPKMDTINPYLNNDDEWLTNLGMSVLENGTHWIYIVRHRRFISGNHRIMSLRHLAEKGVISREHKVLCIDMEIDSTFSPLIGIKTLKAKEIEDLEEFGLETEKRLCRNYRGWIEAILRIPKMMKVILYNYKQETGEEYKTLSVINNIDELKRRAEK